MLHVSCSKFSQLSNSEMFLKIFQQLTKLSSAMQCLPFLDHPVHVHNLLARTKVTRRLLWKRFSDKIMLKRREEILCCCCLLSAKLRDIGKQRHESGLMAMTQKQLINNTRVIEWRPAAAPAAVTQANVLLFHHSSVTKHRPLVRRSRVRASCNCFRFRLLPVASSSLSSLICAVEET